MHLPRLIRAAPRHQAARSDLRTPVEGCEYVSFGMPPESSNTGWIAQRAINFMKCSTPIDRPGAVRV